MLVSPVILWTHYALILVLADVIANDLGQLGVIGRCYCHVVFLFATDVFVLAGVIASCFVFFMADGDVIAIWLVFLLADVIAICFCGCCGHLIISCTKKCTTVLVVCLWQMYCQNG